MIYKMYTIHDSAVKAFTPPTYARTHGEAERSFKANVNNSENGHLYHSPENFTLFYIGEFNDETGLANLTEAPQSVITAIQCVNKEQTLRSVGT